MPSARKDIVGSEKNQPPSEKHSESTSAPSFAEYYDHVALASSTENYFTFRECYLDIMSRDAALVIQKLINRLGYLMGRKKVREDRYFRFSREQMGEALRMDEDCQTRVLNELQGIFESWKGKKRIGKNHDEARQFIKMANRGFPATRHVWIDFVKLNRALDEAAKRPVPGGYRRLKKSQEIPQLPVTAGDRRLPSPSAGRLPATTILNKPELNKPNTVPSAEPRDGTAEVDQKKMVNGIFVPPVVLSFASVIAEQVYRRLGELGKLTRRYKTISPWVTKVADFVGFLAETRKINKQNAEELFRAVVEYHLDRIQIKDQFQPSCFSIPSICDGFAKLEAAYDRRAAVEPAAPEVSEDAREVVERLTERRQWPNGSEDRLPQAVQQSLDGHRAFKAAVEKVLAKEDLDGRLRRFIEERIVPDMGGKSTRRVTRWFEDLWEKVRDWESWSGSFKGYIWCLDSERIQQLGRRAAKEYGFAKGWDRLLEELR